jgi:NAD(P)-dependent dehydrogenase (short-subunit alcohol dehydrogenase family)
MLNDKTIIVTGVGTGLGRELACQCVRDGARVVLGARTESQLEAVAKEADPSGERVAVVPTDINDPEACDRIVAQAEARFGRVDGLAQIAAYELAFGRLAETDFEAWRKAFDTNVIGTLQLVRAAAPRLAKAGGGSVVLIGSQSMFYPMIEQAGYASSKGALLTSMYYLAKELGPEGIRVNTVVPSWMWGPPVEIYLKMQSKARGIPPEQVKQEIEAGIPLGEMTADEEVAQVVAFFLSDRARKVTGQSLMVNGGELMR